MYKYMYHVKHGVLIFTCQTIFSGRWRPQCHQCVLDPFVNKSARCMRLSLTYFQLIRSRSVSYLYFNDVTILILLGGFFVGKKSYVTTNSERSKIKAIKESVYTNYKNILAPCKIVNLNTSSGLYYLFVGFVYSMLQALFTRINSCFKKLVAQQLNTLEVSKNGGPQHGSVLKLTVLL